MEKREKKAQPRWQLDQHEQWTFGLATPLSVPTGVMEQCARIVSGLVGTNLMAFRQLPEWPTLPNFFLFPYQRWKLSTQVKRLLSHSGSEEPARKGEWRRPAALRDIIKYQREEVSFSSGCIRRSTATVTVR
jgi:hypothetical protein